MLKIVAHLQLWLKLKGVYVLQVKIKFRLNFFNSDWFSIFFCLLAPTIHKLFSIVWGAQSGCWRGKESRVQVLIEDSYIFIQIYIS